MVPYIEYENDNLPFFYLPYAYRSRLIQLAALRDAIKISIACPEMKTLSHRRRECYDHIYITDTSFVGDVVKEQTINFSFCFLKYFVDGPLTMDPTWQSVLLVDDILSKNRSFYIKHTLILHFTSVESYNCVVRQIAGSYSRLVLYGKFTWSQVKHLIHANVNQIRIMGHIALSTTECDNFIQFVYRFSRGIDYK
uniref:F-box domain-containing protein n=1 Tax=Panagrellus redivivus TaxID=6233 RepID=A0A7E4VNK0_PANRE